MNRNEAPTHWNAAQLLSELPHWCNLFFCLEQKINCPGKFRPFNLSELKQLKVKSRTWGLSKTKRFSVWFQLCEMLNLENLPTRGIFTWQDNLFRCSVTHTAKNCFPSSLIWVFLVAVCDCWLFLFTVYIWKESVSIFSMSSFSVVKVAVKSPLDNFFFWTAETQFSWPLLLCHTLQLRYHPCDLLLFLIHSSPSCWCSQSLFSRFSMVCWVERENCFF